MKLPSHSLLLLLLPWTARASVSPFSGSSPTTDGNSQVSVDTLSFIDNFVEQWKLKHPNLDANEVSKIHATAQEMKDNLLNPPPPPPRVTVPLTKPTDIPLPRRQYFARAVGNSTHGTNSTLERAFEIVRLAQREADTRNKERFAKPRVNNYYDHHRTGAMKARAVDNASLRINETISAAAAIVADATAVNVTSINHSKYILPANVAAHFLSNGQNDGQVLSKRAGQKSWWMETIARDGTVPYGGASNNGYRVFRNVKDYGAVGDGKADDTDAIKKAMSDGNRCGADCGSSTVKPAIVYFPSGTYRVRESIAMHYNTQVIGNVQDLPVILADANFVGLGVLSSDVYTGGNGGADEWFINQNNFFRQVRNLIIDTSQASMVNIAGLHWQVAQATSIFNVHFWGSSDRSKNHIGIFAENGSGGFMGDLYFSSITIGIRCGNQQFTSHSLAFNNVGTAVDLLWDWGWTWKDLFFLNTDVGFNMGGDYKGGSMMLLDSRFENVGLGIFITTPKGATDPEEFSITLENVIMSNVKTMVVHGSARTLLDGGSSTIGSWILGRVYDSNSRNGTYEKGRKSDLAPRDPALVNGIKAYYTRGKPQYENKDTSFFLNAHFAEKGDGATDDTFGLALGFAVALDQGRALYIPMGSYIVRQTINIPLGSVVVGECWAQIVAKGAFFQDASDPQPLVTVGMPGSTGSVEIQDLLFTVEGPTAGAILMEWNVAADKQGAGAMWDTHFRIGGAAGSHLQASDCPKLTGSVNKNCMAGSLMLHMTYRSSGYLENVWAWVADHDLDSGPSQTQIDIDVARGILVESALGPVWLYGTSSEHSVLYQYLVYGAKNVVMSMIQTESPYFLPDPQAPAPFKDVFKFPGDPDFKDCDGLNPHCAAAWGLSILASTNIHIYGAGLYNWFQKYIQPCVDTQDCQQRVVNIQNSGQIWLYNLYTIGTVEMINHENDSPVLAKSNTNTNEHPFTSVVNGWLLATDGEGRIPEDPSQNKPDLEHYQPLATCSSSFDKIDDIVAVYNSIPAECIDVYLSKTLYHNLTSSIQKYDDIIRDDYHSKFAIYHDIVRNQAETEIKTYMINDRADGWHCTESYHTKCCNIDCSTGGGNYMDPDCFKLGCSKGDPDTKCLGSHNKTVSCPNEIRDFPDALNWVLDDSGKFYKKMEDSYGIPRDWIQLVDFDVHYNYGCIWNQHDESGKDLAKCQRDTDVFWRNFPVLKKDFDLKDPSELIKKAYDKTRVLIAEAERQIHMADFQLVFWGDISSTLTLPALTMSSSVENMEAIVKVANQKLEADRKAGIAAWVTAIFFFIPLAGEAAAAAGAGLLRTILNLAGTLGDIGYTIYDAITEKDNALTDILGLAFGVGPIKAQFREISQAWRGMRQEKINKIPKNLARDVKTVREMQAFCKL